MCKIITITSVITVSYIQYVNFNVIVKNVLYSLNLQICNNEELVNKRYNLINVPKLIFYVARISYRIILIGSYNYLILVYCSKQTQFYTFLSLAAYSVVVNDRQNLITVIKNTGKSINVINTNLRINDGVN